MDFGALTIWTIGHSTRTIEVFVGLLGEAGITLVADIRSIPRSRAMPQFNADTLPAALAPHGIDYRHLAALGGRRHHPKGAPPSPNAYWQVAAFRNYADYAATPAFRTGLDELLVLARSANCAIMCAEAVWWRCHRRIVTDYLLTRGMTVRHIMGPHNAPSASITPGARPQPDGTLRYPA